MEPAIFFEKMSETVAGLVKAERAGFWQLTGNELVAMHPLKGLIPGVPGPRSLPVPHAGDDQEITRVLYSGQALRLDREGTNADGHDGSLLDLLGARTVLAVPWRTASVPLGILTASNSRSEFTDQDEWIMRLAARSSALVWQGYEAEQRAQSLQTSEMDRLEAHGVRMAELEHQKSEFLQLASHELRAPITLVSGYLSMLEEGSLGTLPETAAKVLPLMSGRMRQMSELVDRLLTTSRLETRARDHKLQDVELDPIIRAVAATAGATASGPSGRISVQSTDLVHLRADPEQVETILTNLVSNALKYSPNSAEVLVSVRAEPRWVFVDVSDRGAGIAENDLSKLFRPFGRLPSAVAAGIHGTGLGLHLSRSLALSQGGDIEVRSTPGEGSTFTLRLPRGRKRPAGRVNV